MSGRETLAQARAAEDAVGAAAMKKAIWRLGPFLGLLYLVAYIDRNNAGFAKLEMTAALQITEAAFGFAAGIFFIGYLLFEVPSNLLLEKFGARKWIARIMISWGIVAALTAFVQDATQFAIARFILGIAEAGFFPGVLLYLTLWFPRQYRTQVLAVFVLSNPIANAVAAPLSGWMLELHGLWGLEGWQLVFLLLGITLSITALSLIAAVAAQGTPVLALAALCVGMSALFSTTPLFWSLPPMVLTGTAAAAGLAFINSVGNLAGFAGPYAIGWISETTGSAVWGLLLISGLTLLGATIAFVLSRRTDFTTAPDLAVEASTARR